MRCCICGVEAPCLKTVRRREGEGTGVLCEGCWLPRRQLVWIIPGPVACFGTCRSCSSWFSLRALVEQKPGSKRDAPSGLCPSCTSNGAPALLCMMPPAYESEEREREC
jgi:hypothetical protein